MPGKEYQPHMPLLRTKRNNNALASATARQVDSQTILRAINSQDSHFVTVCRQLAAKNHLTTPVVTKLLRYGQGKSAYRRVV